MPRWMVPTFVLVDANTPDDADAKAFQIIDALMRGESSRSDRMRHGFILQLDEQVPTCLAHHDAPQTSILQYWYPDSADDGK